MIFAKDHIAGVYHQFLFDKTFSVIAQKSHFAEAPAVTHSSWESRSEHNLIVQTTWRKIATPTRPDQGWADLKQSTYQKRPKMDQSERIILFQQGLKLTS